MITGVNFISKGQNISWQPPELIQNQQVCDNWMMVLISWLRDGRFGFWLMGFD